MSVKGETICAYINCSKTVEYICIVEDGHNVCADHLPPAGQGTEYFWEVNPEYTKKIPNLFEKNDGCPCWVCQLENNE